MRGWMVAGNWKMHNTQDEARTLSKYIVDNTVNIQGGEIVLAPPFTSLSVVYDVIKGSQVKLAAQNMYYEDKGAYTGEVSPAMLKDTGCSYVIIGHSERRKYFHETDEGVNLKTKKALSSGLMPIVCVGETLEEREKGITEYVVGIQVKKALNGIDGIADIVIAYEPVWAIGTGKNATPEEAEAVQKFIRGIVRDIYGSAADNLKILYGGSVTADNIGSLIEMEDIDGALVGGASLKGEGFVGIIKRVAEKR
ncbi:MAG TPA: triose-phosphate isomerase [Syntrophorhabdaceae bacterium]|nr:triose-phosphate isomerase [Syntrophorhabdaceae bacterium]HOL04967.1 triose-phosphate isomerase [Syntrophorhabdaceae bacterium]HON85201.1 triose-phosphate isomerase [Syntrophorhabdaceae bacterium]HOT41998.1 triose-phosphate isomerase [Syntrophorhabdaceae bacterium]HPC66553.1 triose-phosphate isomerase [Syntrophorhabdaceae bacterium]